MSRLLETVDQTFELIERRGLGAALVGGLAVSVHVEPRFTRDIDIVVDVPSDSEAEELVAGMRALGYVAYDIVEQQATGRLATASCHKPSDKQGVLVDLLFASSGIEDAVVAGAQKLDVGEYVLVPVASPVHLVALKVLSRGEQRQQDDLDLSALVQDLSASQLEEVRGLLEVIEHRGYHRGKSLVNELGEVLRRSAER